tara:strand:+ start:1229 stop:1399 length:171 start_codon:yes stop_codon:yes gene_type:complete
MAFPINPIYKLVNDPISGELLNIRTADDRFIPIDEANTDYQEYLKWAKTNTAEPAD